MSQNSFVVGNDHSQLAAYGQTTDGSLTISVLNRAAYTPAAERSEGICHIEPSIAREFGIWLVSWAKEREVKNG